MVSCSIQLYRILIMYKKTVRFYDWRRPTSFKEHEIRLIKEKGNTYWISEPGTMVSNAFRNYAIANENVRFPSRSPVGYWIVREEGVARQKDFGLISHRQGFKNQDFERRCREGEIIISDYQTAFGTAESEVSEILESENLVSNGLYDFAGSNISNVVNFWNGSCPFDFKSSMNKYENNYGSWATHTYFLIGGEWRGIRGALCYQYERKYREGPSFFESTGYSARQVIDEIHKHSMRMGDRDDIAIQEVLAEANSGDADALTAIAELPDTIQSIIDGFKLLKKGFVDWKRKGWDLHNRAEAMSKNMARQRWLKYVQKKRKSFPTYEKWSKRRTNRGKSIKSYHDERNRFLNGLIPFELYLAKKHAQFRREAWHELADAVASVELNARYNIQTNVLMLQDFADAFFNYGEEYFRYRKRIVKEHQKTVFNSMFGVGNWTFSGVYTETHRAFIKRSYDVSTDLKKVSRALSADIVVTGVELIRLWSIVFDWFFTISSCLRALNWNPKHTQQGSCYSIKTECSGTLKVKDGEDRTAEMQISYNGYNRNVIFPNASIGIYWDPDLSFIRQLDALAFFWTSNRGTLKSYYSR